MQAVRCEACGMKALVAASQCPHCGHLLELRDSFGELLPLTHCSTCSCDYPTRHGHCRWCGTTPHARRFEASTLWKGVGALALIGMAIGVWATRDTSPDLAGERPAPNDTASRARTFTPIAPDTPVTIVNMPGDTPRDTSSVVASMPVAMESTYVVPPAPEPVVAETSLPTGAAARNEPVPAPAPVVVTPPPARATVRAPARASAVRWRSVVARNWVTVRAAPKHGSRLLGSLGPDTRIQLGESRGGWVRVRMRGLAGWVHASRLSTRSLRTGTLARR